MKVGSNRPESFYSHYGDLQYEPIQVAAGLPIPITLEWDDAKDWSLVAWGEEGELTLYHKNGVKSDEFPYIAREEGKPGSMDFDPSLIPDTTSEDN